MAKRQLKLNSPFSKGLRADINNALGRESLFEAYNCRITPYGVQALEIPVNPTMDAVDFPFPQVFNGSTAVIKADDTAIYTLDRYWNPTVVTTLALSTYTDWGIVGSAGASIVDGGTWHYSDNGDFRFLFNGNCVVFSIPSVGTFTSGAVYTTTGCMHRGRLFLGGLDNLIQGSWTTRFNAFRDDVYTSVTPAFSKNWVWWSSIGFDDALWHFFPWMMTGKGIEGVVGRREFGFASMSWSGRVLCTKSLGNGVIVYGENGISYLQQNGEDPALGVVEIANFGIQSRGAVGGDSGEQYFISTEGMLWKITADLKLTKLGYEEFFLPFEGNEVAICVSPFKGDVYISSRLHGYLLSLSGLSWTPHRVTSIAIQDGIEGFIYSSYADTHVRLLTGIFDMGTKSYKTLTGLLLEQIGSSSLEVSIYYRMRGDVAFSSTAFVTVPADGVLDLSVTGVEFMLALRADSPASLDLRGVDIMFTQGENVALTGVLG